MFRLFDIGMLYILDVCTVFLVVSVNFMFCSMIIFFFVLSSYGKKCWNYFSFLWWNFSNALVVFVCRLKFLSSMEMLWLPPLLFIDWVGIMSIIFDVRHTCILFAYFVFLILSLSLSFLLWRGRLSLLGLSEQTNHVCKFLSKRHI